jgi:uncharacterized membrane protein YfcA
LLLAGFPPLTIALLVVILAASALMSGLSGFGFSAIGALCLILLPPKLGVPLLMTLSAANQIMSLRQLKADMAPIKHWWPDGPAPYLLGGLIGVPVGLAILSSLPSADLMLVFGAFLVIYAGYSLSRPPGAHKTVSGGWLVSSLVGMSGGVIGGFTAFPGAAVVVWNGLRHVPKREARAIVQPYIFVLQLLSISLLALQKPETFGPTYWLLVAITVPVVLPCTLLGVKLYRQMSDVNFRRVTFILLGISGMGLLIKAADAFPAVAHAVKVAGL